MPSWTSATFRRSDKCGGLNRTSLDVSRHVPLSRSSCSVHIPVFICISLRRPLRLPRQRRSRPTCLKVHPYPSPSLLLGGPSQYALDQNVEKWLPVNSKKIV